MFFLFAGMSYYPEGGMGDYVGTYATLEEAQAAYWSNGSDYQWAHIATVINGELKRVSVYKAKLKVWHYV
jgi:hypothetical protein